MTTENGWQEQNNNNKAIRRSVHFHNVTFHDDEGDYDQMIRTRTSTERTTFGRKSGKWVHAFSAHFLCIWVLCARWSANEYVDRPIKSANRKEIKVDSIKQKRRQKKNRLESIEKAVLVTYASEMCIFERFKLIWTGERKRSWLQNKSKGRNQCKQTLIHTLCSALNLTHAHVSFSFSVILKQISKRHAYHNHIMFAHIRQEENTTGTAFDRQIYISKC